MKYIGKNDQLIQFFDENYSLLDGQLKKVQLAQEDSLGLVVELDIVLTHEKVNKFVRLRFSEVELFLFTYQKDYIFYNIEIFKFFKAPLGYYLSLDPVDESALASDKDNDVIIGGTVEAYFLEVISPTVDGSGKS